MKFNLADPVEREQYIDKSRKLLDAKKKVDLKEIRSIRTLKQNSYLHKIMSLMAIDWGWADDEMKTYLKRECPFMRYSSASKDGKTVWFLRQTSQLDTKEMGEFIDWIFNFAAQHDCHIPTSEEYLQNQEGYEDAIRKHREYQWNNEPIPGK